MKTYKKLFAVLLAVVLVVALYSGIAVANASNASADAEKPADVKEVTVNFTLSQDVLANGTQIEFKPYGGEEYKGGFYDTEIFGEPTVVAMNDKFNQNSFGQLISMSYVPKTADDPASLDLKAGDVIVTIKYPVAEGKTLEYGKTYNFTIFYQEFFYGDAMDGNALEKTTETASLTFTEPEPTPTPTPEPTPTPTPEPTPTPAPATPTPSTPVTADTNHVGTYAAVFAGALVLLAVAFVVLRKTRKNNG